MPLGLGPMEKVTGARLLHDIWPGETSHLTEPIVAVDDGTVLHSGICNDKFFICNKKTVCYHLQSFLKILIDSETVCWTHVIPRDLGQSALQRSSEAKVLDKFRL